MIIDTPIGSNSNWAVKVDGKVVQQNIPNKQAAEFISYSVSQSSPNCIVEVVQLTDDGKSILFG